MKGSESPTREYTVGDGANPQTGLPNETVPTTIGVGASATSGPPLSPEQAVEWIGARLYLFSRLPIAQTIEAPE